MQFSFLGQQLVWCLAIVLIGYTAINGANSSALRLFVKALALSTLVGHNKIGIYRNRLVRIVSIGHGTIHQRKCALQRCAIGHRPFHTTFIYSIIGAFWFTGAAIDTFVSYFYCHC